MSTFLEWLDNRKIVKASKKIVFPGFDGTVGHVYNVFKDIMATVVFVTVIIAAYRRGIQRPARYAVPEKYGHDHTGEAVWNRNSGTGKRINQFGATIPDRKRMSMER